MEIKVELGLRAPTLFATSRVTGGEPGPENSPPFPNTWKMVTHQKPVEKCSETWAVKSARR